MGLHGGVQLACDLRRRLGRRVGEAARMQDAPEHRPVGAIGGLQRCPLVDLGWSHHDPCLHLWGLLHAQKLVHPFLARP